MEIPNGTKIAALWLTTGKKLDTSKGVVLADKGAIVRVSDTNMVVVSPNSIVAVEVIYPDKEGLDKILNG